jgi:hypothetical protein
MEYDNNVELVLNNSFVHLDNNMVLQLTQFLTEITNLLLFLSKYMNKEENIWENIDN